MMFDQLADDVAVGAAAAASSSPASSGDLASYFHLPMSYFRIVPYHSSAAAAAAEASSSFVAVVEESSPYHHSSSVDLYPYLWQRRPCPSCLLAASYPRSIVALADSSSQHLLPYSSHLPCRFHPSPYFQAHPFPGAGAAAEQPAYQQPSFLSFHQRPPWNSSDLLPLPPLPAAQQVAVVHDSSPERSKKRTEKIEHQRHNLNSKSEDPL